MGMMCRPRAQCGFTLTEMMIVVAVLAVLAVLAYPSFRGAVREGRLSDAQAAMVKNVNALNQHYMRRFSYKENSTTWPKLDVLQTEHFCIRMQGNPRGTNRGEDGYTMKAVALDKTAEPRVLLMNQDQQLMVCESSTSVCPSAQDEHAYFANPGRADKNCTTR